jgi:glycosyltransferase involved in cell wall biosynthesis
MATGVDTGIVYDLQAYGFSPHGGIARIFDELFAHIQLAKTPFKAYLYTDHHLQRYPATGSRVVFHPDGLTMHPLLRRFPALRHAAQPLLQSRRKKLNIRLHHPTFYPGYPTFAHLPTVVNVYDLVHETIEHADNMPDHRGYLDIKRQWIERAARLICISEATRDDLLHHYHVPRDRVHVIHLGYGSIFRPKEITPQPDRPFFLYVGSRQRYKNFHRLVAAYGAWNKRDDIDLVVVGGRCQQDDRHIMDNAGNPTGVRFTGPVSDEQLCDLYNQAAGFIYPSLKEGFGIPLLEALACRCPMLISDIPVFREVAADQALYMDPLRIESMVDGLDRLLAFDKSGWSDEARQSILSRYSWEKCSREILSVYQEVLA